MHRLNVAFLVLDAIGLVVFTMAGCDVAWQMDASLPIVIVAGMITGCAGGVLRDILCNDVPLLFRSELYASVSVVTGLFYATAFGLKLNDELWTALTFVLGLTLRLLAIRYKWEMPKFVFTGMKRGTPDCEQRLQRSGCPGLALARASLARLSDTALPPRLRDLSAVTSGAALPQELRI